MGARPDEEDPEETLQIGVPWRLALTGRRPIVILASALLVVGAAIIAARGTHPARRPVAASVPPSGVALPPETRPLAIDPNLPDQCAHGIPCIEAHAVPRGTSEAIVQFLSGAHERMSYTVTRGDTNRLLYRVVNATAGSVELLVKVGVPPASRPAATEARDPTPGASIRYARRQIGTYEVEVQYTGPPGGTPPVTLAVRLSQDPRLLEVA